VLFFLSASIVFRCFGGTLIEFGLSIETDSIIEAPKREAYS